MRPHKPSTERKFSLIPSFLRARRGISREQQHQGHNEQRGVPTPTADEANAIESEPSGTPVMQLPDARHLGKDRSSDSAGSDGPAIGSSTSAAHTVLDKTTRDHSPKDAVPTPTADDANASRSEPSGTPVSHLRDKRRKDSSSDSAGSGGLAAASSMSARGQVSDKTPGGHSPKCASSVSTADDANFSEAATSSVMLSRFSPALYSGKDSVAYEGARDKTSGGCASASDVPLDPTSSGQGATTGGTDAFKPQDITVVDCRDTVVTGPESSEHETIILEALALANLVRYRIQDGADGSSVPVFEDLFQEITGGDTTGRGTSAAALRPAAQVDSEGNMSPDHLAGPPARALRLRSVLRDEVNRLDSNGRNRRSVPNSHV